MNSEGIKFGKCQVLEIDHKNERKIHKNDISKSFIETKYKSFSKNLFNIGNIFKEIGEYNNAIQAYEKAIQIKSNYADAHNNLGLIFQKMKELKDKLFLKN